MIFLQVVIGIFVFIVLVGLVYLIIQKKRDEEEPENETILENYMPQYSKGHTDGIIREIQVGESRVKITFYPRDINYIREINKDKKFRIKPITIFFDKKQVIPFPDFSSHRHKIKAFPHKVSLLPEGLLNTPFGKKVAEVITENSQLKDESELMQMRMVNLQKISEETFGGKIFTDFVEKTKAQMKDLGENTTKKDEKFFNQNVPKP